MKKKTQSDKAYESLKEYIANAEVDSYISARQFTNTMGMSYTPVREAFLRLQKEGLLRQIPNVGFFVQNLDYQAIMQIFQVRECLELFVMEQVFDDIDASHCDKLSSLIEQQHMALHERDTRKYITADTEIHKIPFEIYKNQYFINLYTNVRERYIMCSNHVAKSGSEEAIAEHQMFLECIKKHDKQQTLEVLRRHIDGARQRMKDGFIRY